jgi:hypothetical protein
MERTYLKEGRIEEQKNFNCTNTREDTLASAGPCVEKTMALIEWWAE